MFLSGVLQQSCFMIELVDIQSASNMDKVRQSGLVFVSHVLE